MKKHFLAISLIALASLTSCFDDSNSTPKQSSKDSTSVNSNESKKSDSNKSDSKTDSTKPSPVEPAPTFTDEDFSYLLGDFYSKNSKVTISNSKLTLKTNSTLELIPTNVEEVTLEYSKTEDEEETKTYDTIMVEFSAAYNNGVDYQAYINFDDGLLHLDKIENEDKPSNIDTYMPDIKEFAGAYSAFGDSSAYNVYMMFSGEFDLERGVFPSSHKSAYAISYEQAWYIESSYVNLDGKVYKVVQEFDSDQYGYGKNIIYKNTDKNNIYIFSGTTEYSIDYDFFEYVTDIGVAQNLNVFDGEKTITLNINIDDSTITFDTLSGTYEKVVDDDGLKLKAKFGDKNYIFSFGEKYIVANDGTNSKVYPIDDISDLYGEFNSGVNTFKIVEQYDEETFDLLDPKVYFNNVETTYKYVTANNRKSIQFEKDGITYTISPDKEKCTIRLDTNGVISYPINESKFKDLYIDTFVAHEKDSSFSFTISSDMMYEFSGEKGLTTLSYWHGNRYPSLNFTYNEKDYSLNLVQEDIGYYELTSDNSTNVIYSQTALNKVYGEYSSNYENSFVFTPYVLIKDGISYSYSFKPYYVETSGLYNFGITTDETDGEYINNLYGTFLSHNTSYIKKDLYSSLVGTYQAYGKYGIENIKFTEEGKLLLDVVNSTNDGLEKDVEFPYIAYTNTSNQTVLTFNIKTVDMTITFSDNYVTIANLNYYDSNLVSAWGTFTDSDNTLFIQNDEVYLNGEELSIKQINKEDDKTIFITSSYTITYYKNTDNITLDSDSSCVKLTRKFNFTDFDKFVGSYTINDSKVVVSKSSTIGYSFTIDGSDVSYYITKHNDKLTLVLSSTFTKYYLMLNEETGEITTDFESSIPVPPAPPAI